MNGDEEDDGNQKFFFAKPTQYQQSNIMTNNQSNDNDLKERQRDKNEAPLLKNNPNAQIARENKRDTMAYKDFWIAGQTRDAGIVGRTASRIYFLRSFNNWIKAVQINKYSQLLDSNLSVLDLGCGRGGDLNKYFQTKTKLYVGADLSEESLKNAMDRITKIKSEKYRNNFTCKCIFIPEDLSDPNNHLMEKINKDYYFDLVSCQFSMHYHFESLERVRAFLLNVVGRLTDGGYFIGTIIDDNVIIKRLRNRHYPGNKYLKEKLTFGNEFYSIHFNQKSFPKEKGPYGIKYGFFLEDSIDKRDEEGDIKYVGEYLVIFDEFVKLCKEFDLHLVEKENFTEFYQENMKNPYYERIFKKMINDINNPSKVQQWEIIQLYTVFAFRKGKVEQQDKKQRYVSYLNKTKIAFKDYEPFLYENTFE